MSKLKLDIGCGGKGSMYPDFIGIDIWPEPENPRSSAQYLRHDFINDPLHYKWMNNCDEIIAFHIIEHLPYDVGTELMRQIYRCLSSGSKAYVSCPDLYLFCKKYMEHDAEFYAKEYRPGRPMWEGDTLADKLNYQIHQNDHRWAYDYTSLALQAKKGGFTDIKRLPLDHPWCKRPDHEVGVILTK